MGDFEILALHLHPRENGCLICFLKDDEGQEVFFFNLTPLRETELGEKLRKAELPSASYSKSDPETWCPSATIQVQKLRASLQMLSQEFDRIILCLTIKRDFV